MARGISITGLDALQTKLLALGISPEEITSILRRGADHIAKEIALRVPVVTGKLRESILSFGLKPVKSRRSGAMVLASERRAPHLHLFAFGRKQVKAGTYKGKPSGKRILFSAQRKFGPARQAKALPGNDFFEQGVLASRDRVRNMVRYDLEQKILEKAQA